MEKKHQTLKELPISERPYEKCEKSGVEALSDAELLAVVLRSGTKDLTVVDLSKQILSMNPFYEGLLESVTLPEKNYKRYLESGK